MRQITLSILVGSALVAGAVSPAAAINCEQVRRYLATGRTVDQIAEQMIVDVEEVKKCAAEAPAATPAAAPAEAE
jgi:predicted transposase YdaD